MRDTTAKREILMPKSSAVPHMPAQWQAIPFSLFSADSFLINPTTLSDLSPLKTMRTLKPFGVLTTARVLLKLTEILFDLLFFTVKSALINLFYQVTFQRK